MSDAEAVIEAVERLANVQVLGVTSEHGTIPVMAVPKGMTLQSVKPLIDEFLSKPERAKGTARLTTLESFIEHVDRYRSEESVVFVSDRAGEASLLAVYDYSSTTEDADWGEHRAAYDFPMSDEWHAWNHSSPRGQEAFAQFLEDRIDDVLDPAALREGESNGVRFAAILDMKLATPSALIALAQGLSLSVDHKVSQRVNLTSGETQVRFQEQHKDEAGAPVNVPGGFVVAIPVFRGGALYELPVRLRYRVQEGKIRWTVQLHRSDRAYEHALREAVQKVAHSTGLATLYGQPEGR